MTQLNLLHPSPPPSGLQCIERPGLRLRFWPRWLADEAHWFKVLEHSVPWKQDQITLWGRTHPLPRLTCWMGDPGCSYTYSGVSNTIESWGDEVSQVKQQVEQAVGWRFNSLLLNLYRHGRDKLDWHADDEPELDPAAPIASLSLGAARSFRLRPRHANRQPGDSLCFELGAGDLLVMDPPTQEHWLHQVPQRLRLNQPRLNLTFRTITAVARPLATRVAPAAPPRR
ncbi:MAG: alpha-ketoglutarate-dependent dioxygenase AlkB [Cyanobacteriota bacterium]|nr:alpha-ketoglutarate-dependent dioxygenase AlkB [Cyanobacteriota bacterium]